MLNAQQIQEPSKQNYVKVKSFCSFNLGIGMVCKREKSVSSPSLGQQNTEITENTEIIENTDITENTEISKRTLRWGR